MEFIDGVVEKILSGCPNLEYLELDEFSGIHRLEISSMKLRELIIDFDFDLGKEQYLEKETSLFKKILHSVAHVENLTLGSWRIECLSILELKGLKFPPSSRKFLKLGVEFNQLDFPGIYCFLQTSLDLETLVIYSYDVELGYLLSWYTDWDQETRMLEPHNFNGSFSYLKIIKMLNFNGWVLPLINYLLKHAIVLEKFDIVAAVQRNHTSLDYVTVASEVLSYPRSSPHASVLFSYR
ncbi:putative F-box/LRR-repeat protein At3g18150 [Solanum lycopersicum]|uniref:putative F-box/LRR-repeat protein At3g18150 n=1 Tax=Solanum lycopersicum TaxID=4081 RepID=UPI003748805F